MSSSEVVNLKTPLVITEEKYCFDKPISLVLREKLTSVSGDSFTIKDIYDTDYFKCKGKALSIKDKKIIYDIYDRPILNMQDKALDLYEKRIYRGNSTTEKLCKISPSNLITKKKFAVPFTNLKTNEKESFEMRCDFLGDLCEIYYGSKKNGGKLVCKVHFKFTKGALFDHNKYIVEIGANVDAAVMVALAIAFDEYKHD